MSILSRLFGKDGSSAAPEAEPELYGGFAIYAEPEAEGGQWRISGRIEKTVDDTLRSYRLIRADTLGSREAAVSATVAKAQQVIDEQGERLFS
jgi:hypothetical protein